MSDVTYVGKLELVELEGGTIYVFDSENETHKIIPSNADINLMRELHEGKLVYQSGNQYSGGSYQRLVGEGMVSRDELNKLIAKRLEFFGIERAS